jgi:anti-sigma factor ChrR (cupin superfamily)
MNPIVLVFTVFAGFVLCTAVVILILRAADRGVSRAVPALHIRLDRLGYSIEYSDSLVGCEVSIWGGKGAGQRRRIVAVDEDGSVLLDRRWVEDPNETSQFSVIY